MEKNRNCIKQLDKKLLNDDTTGTTKREIYDFVVLSITFETENWVISRKYRNNNKMDFMRSCGSSQIERITYQDINKMMNIKKDILDYTEEKILTCM